MARRSLDVAGEELWSFYKTGQPRYEIIERDDGRIAANEFGPTTYFSEYRNWDPLDRKAVRLARGRVLDIGCGAGRHALHLQDRGFDVTAIDESPLAVRIARLRGVRKVRLLGLDGVGVFAEGSFETILLMGYNFGLFGTPRKARRLLRVLHRITTAGGRIVAVTYDPAAATDPLNRAYRARQKRRGRWQGQARSRLRYRELIGPWFEHLSVTKGELRTLVKGTGWQVCRILDGSGGTYAMLLGK